MKMDSWIFNYRSYCPDDSDSDSNHSSDGSKHNNTYTSEESRLRSELDISTRPDAAVFKPNPFSIAKMNAFTRSSRTVLAKPTQPTEKPKNTGTLDAFFGKKERNAAPKHGRIARKEPAAYKKPLTTGHCTLLASSPLQSSANSHDMEKQTSEPSYTSVALRSDSTDRPKLNAFGMLSNRRHHVDTDVARHRPDTRCVSSNGDVTHTPIQVRIQKKLSTPLVSPLSKQTSNLIHREATSLNASPLRRVVNTNHHGKENHNVVLYQGSHPLVSARGNQESPLPVISSTNDRKSSSVLSKPKYASGATPAILLQATARSERAPMERLVKLSKIDSIAHIPTPTVRSPPKCYEAKPDEDGSWSTLPPRKKFKPSAQRVSNYKMTGPFHIPGLRHDADVMKTGMSATSSTRVITFLPTPLLPASHEGQVKTESENQSSPQSSPRSQYYPSFDEEIEGTRFPYSSPPTSDPPQVDYDLNIQWDTHHLEERYAKVPKAIEEHRRSKQLIWNLLGLDSNCYVYRDGDEVETDVRIVLWRG